MSVTVSTTVSSSGMLINASKTFSPSDEGVVYSTISVATGQTDKAWSFGGVDVSQAVAVIFKSDKAVTLETNSTNASGGNTITLAADVPYVWCTGSPNSLLLTADISNTIYVTNASGSTATISGLVVMDSTP